MCYLAKIEQHYVNRQISTLTPQKMVDRDIDSNITICEMMHSKSDCVCVCVGDCERGERSRGCDLDRENYGV